MALISQTGTYMARPESWGIKAEEGKCPRFGIVFRCEQMRVGAGWEPVEGDQRITGYFTLFNTDNGPNEINLRALRESLGWDGASLSSLEGGDWSDVEVQIVVDNHEYQGKKSLEVRYLNPKDYAGGVQKADPQTVESLDQRYGATLRALFKTKPNGGNGTIPAAGRMAGSAAPKESGGGTATLTMPASAATDSAKQQAWQAFTEKTPTYSPAKRSEVFKQLVTECLPVGREPRSATAEEWQTIARHIEGDFNEATGAFIPF